MAEILKTETRPSCLVNVFLKRGLGEKIMNINLLLCDGILFVDARVKNLAYSPYKAEFTEKYIQNLGEDAVMIPIETPEDIWKVTDIPKKDAYVSFYFDDEKFVVSNWEIVLKSGISSKVYTLNDIERVKLTAEMVD